LILSQLVGIALLVPFFGWAIVLLRRRFQYYEENSLALEMLTAGGLALFLWIEVSILGQALSDKLLYLFAILGLSVSTFALYAHLLISLASRIVVDMISPRGESAAYQPRFGPVDALEREEDYEGALQEYLVLARIYPRNFEVLSRTGRVQEILGNMEEAVTWYQRARKRAARADEALAAVNHLCNLYDTKLNQPEQADHELATFIQDYPNSLDRDIVVERLERRANRSGFSLSQLLEALEENPLPEEPLEEVVVPARQPVELVMLEAAGAAEAEPVREARPRTPSGIGLERIELSMEKAGSNQSSSPPVAPALSRSAPKTTPLQRLGLESLDTPQTKPSQNPAGDPEPRDSKPRITLESMDS
jgi:tetratricopeptide (TPR) repeat protein